MNYEKLINMLDSPEWAYYNGEALKLIEGCEAMADQPQVEISERLWYLAKAQGLKEALKLPLQWREKRKS